MQDIFVKVFFFFSFTPQWLVKKAIERKEEMGDYIREFSVSQFSKYHTTPQVNAKCFSWELNSWKSHLCDLWGENNRALWACAGGTPSQNFAQTHTSEPAWKLGASPLWGFCSRNGKGSHTQECHPISSWLTLLDAHVRPIEPLYSRAQDESLLAFIVECKAFFFSVKIKVQIF